MLLKFFYINLLQARQSEFFDRHTRSFAWRSLRADENHVSIFQLFFYAFFNIFCYFSAVRQEATSPVVMVVLRGWACKTYKGIKSFNSKNTLPNVHPKNAQIQLKYRN